VYYAKAATTRRDVVVVVVVVAIFETKAIPRGKQKKKGNVPTMFSWYDRRWTTSAEGTTATARGCDDDEATTAASRRPIVRLVNEESIASRRVCAVWIVVVV